MNNAINSCCSRQPTNAGINISCYTVDPTKLPPDSPLLKTGSLCCIGPCGQNGMSYPSNYYTNNFNGNSPINGPTRKKRIQVLTDNYVKNLEQYLNSPSEDMRKFAAREVIKRLDEDKSRYNDAALNALINKMLLDPSCHKVKATALTALDTQLAQGNDTTVKILTNMAQNDKSRNGADAATASSILLKMSSPTKLIDVPINNSSDKGVSEL